MLKDNFYIDQKVSPTKPPKVIKKRCLGCNQIFEIEKFRILERFDKDIPDFCTSCNWEHIKTQIKSEDLLETQF